MDKFILHSEYKPTGDQPKAIDSLVDGVLKVCTGTEKPGYISDAKRDEAVEEGAVIPVIKVCEDMVFETENTASFASVKLGDKVTVSEDGLGVTATTTDGVCEVVYISDEAKNGTGGKVLVRIV